MDNLLQINDLQTTQLKIAELDEQLKSAKALAKQQTVQLIDILKINSGLGENQGSKTTIITSGLTVKASCKVEAVIPQDIIDMMSKNLTKHLDAKLFLSDLPEQISSLSDSTEKSYDEFINAAFKIEVKLNLKFLNTFPPKIKETLFKELGITFKASDVTYEIDTTKWGK